ncbi:MAG: hypothetical protein GC180_02665 [Bacteroidetes bacterium]|nr:hypothetical protein [Bacteroidota bacterium]
MKKTLFNIALATSILSLAACGGNQQENKEKGEEAPSAPEASHAPCNYEYDASQNTLSWTAYKYTERAGVKGGFDSVYMTPGTTSTTDITQMLLGATFRIPVSSVNTSNPDRDKKIAKFFFGSLIMSSDLSGSVTDVDGNNQSGDITFNLHMNAVDAPVSMHYEMNGDILILKGTMSTDEWQAGEGIKNLNKECKELHTGSDGKSVLWPDVSLEFRTVLKEVCP